MRFSPVGSLKDWIALMRVNRPVGYWLLLWPTMWGLLAASNGQPDTTNLIIFIAGVFLMRSAGCIINDFADRKLDPHVERTKERPIAAGRIAPGAALAGFVGMLVVALILALLLVWQSSVLMLELAVIGALLAAIYPFLKRFTHFPQAWLGMAFGWGAVMAWAAETGSVTDSTVPWLLFAANVFWSLSYDTAYALGDRLDDLKVGVKSTAIFFGDHAVKVIVLLAVIVLALLAVVSQGYGIAVWMGWFFAVSWQLLLCIRLLIDGEEWGFTYFLMSHWTGLFFALGFIINGFIAP
ncbi:MAG: 4-hydroxybenzoate octaprenyltransferase [Mariprofundaceae bacterium]